ncbi:hypothetical protein [Photorhabdus sp. CRCIA-P01]|uniref:hypothetical protein n=1 Tax=Photorhabdus sp. CRCIA-P01 TaxID=2019570 RepID=UPI001E5DB68F|nr:hypothetical protein [Photorhabdus sp. CRCIA-P01]
MNDGYFLIADNQDKTSAISANVPSQTATYYPAVKIQAEKSATTISGYEDATTKPDAVKNLTQLKEKNKNAYQKVVDVIPPYYLLAFIMKL